MNVLSLFDGMACARVALERVGYEVDAYYASEVYEPAITVATANYPDIIELGDVKAINGNDLPEIDLLIGGSPCQDLTITNYHRKGLDGSRSALFWEFVRLKNETNPKHFVLENVASMRDDDRDRISDALGAKPVVLDAIRISAQSRKRLFWADFPITPLTETRAPLSEVCGEPVKGAARRTRAHKGPGKRMEVRRDDKCNAITSVSNDSLVLLPDGSWRNFTRNEYERLQGLPDGYTDSVSYARARKLVSNAFNVDVVAHVLRCMP